MYESSQFAHGAKLALIELFGLEPEQVRVISRHVGGGFGSKGQPRPQMVLAVMAAQASGRPVKVALTRRQMFPISGYRTPTIQRVRLGADRDGRLLAWEHQAYSQTSTVSEFTEPSTTGTRIMYAAENRFNSHHIVRLDVPSPGFCRAPGEAPGFFALESALDELAVACGVDPVELRIRNEPELDPNTGQPFSTRNLVACLREGPRGSGGSSGGAGGTAAGSSATAWRPRCTRPTRCPRRRGSARGTARTSSWRSTRRTSAQARAPRSGRSPRTSSGAVRQRARRARGLALPYAIGAFGSMGTNSWGHAIVLACRALRARLDALDGELPPDGILAEADTTTALRRAASYSSSAYGAQFAQVRVDADSGEVRVSRLLGVFAAGRIINPRMVRSQLVGGMTWGSRWRFTRRA